ncbi:bifunctional cysteine desulfurase/selenocysteine lyase [Serratia rubidaea]|uniref:Bifunctional cysteine desulfurase/selenocysteine lyase n=1 Tax=Serratia rubidaea TaxID=61652 RepID=A0A447QT25_SERRU|nr:bifunctional cysteine desulfurase/selenocysteine lyase [Serratia rubidaea]
MTFTPERARAQFGALSQHYQDKPVIFFDGPGGSQVSRGVLDNMTGYLGSYNANLGGHYFSSKVTEQVMHNARESVRALLNAPAPDNIVFGMNMTSLTFHLSRIISRTGSPVMRLSSPRWTTTPMSPVGNRRRRISRPSYIIFRCVRRTARWTPSGCARRSPTKPG